MVRITPEDLHTCHRWIRLDEVTRLPGNPNLGDYTSLSASLNEFGWFDGIIVHDGVLLAGNHRYEQAAAAGLEGLPGYDLSRFPMSDAERMASAVAHNHTTRAGVNDPTLLTAALDALGPIDPALRLGEAANPKATHTTPYTARPSNADHGHCPRCGQPT